MLRQMDRELTEEELLHKEEEMMSSIIKPEIETIETIETITEIEMKKDREEGELEEGELPDSKSQATTTHSKSQSSKVTGSHEFTTKFTKFTKFDYTISDRFFGDVPGDGPRWQYSAIQPRSGPRII